jgi:KRAB domain-containing zinc finger protein
VKHKRRHNGEKPYECDVCKKRFLVSSALEEHKRIHTGDKPYECNVCKNRFARSSNLARHKKTHAENKPYECDVCKKRFFKVISLERHKKRIHITDTLKYECDICKRKFTQLNQDDNATSQCAECQETESDEVTGFVCSLCGLGFGILSELEDHMVTHNVKDNWGHFY